MITMAGQRKTGGYRLGPTRSRDCVPLPGGVLTGIFLPRTLKVAGTMPSRTTRIRERAKLDPKILALASREQEWFYGGDTWCMSIVRNGVLAAEFQSFDAMDSSRFDVYSVTKSFTSLAFGIVLNDPTYAGHLDLGSAAYEFIPEGYPLTDERKARVTVGQLLSMTGGFSGHYHLTAGTHTRLGDGIFEHLLGRVPNRYGYDAGQLIADPGTQWEYSDPGFSHLSLVFAHVTGSELDTFLNERLFGPIGVPAVSWCRSGGGKWIGPHTIAHCGLVLSSRELARSRLFAAPRWRVGWTPNSQQGLDREGYSSFATVEPEVRLWFLDEQQWELVARGTSGRVRHDGVPR